MKTIELEQHIADSETFDEQLIKENATLPVFTYIEQLMDERGIKKSAIIKKLNVERSYGYQILNGTRIPTREHLLKISLAMKLSLEDTQKVLKTGCKSILYARNIEDAKAIYAIEHELDYDDAVNFIWGE